MSPFYSKQPASGGSSDRSCPTSCNPYNPSDPDLDLYYEGPAVSRVINQKVAEPEFTYHGFGVPRGWLLGALREGHGFAFGVVEDARVFVDRGPFRDALRVIEEGGAGYARPGGQPGCLIRC